MFFILTPTLAAYSMATFIESIQTSESVSSGGTATDAAAAAAAAALSVCHNCCAIHLIIAGFSNAQRVVTLITYYDCIASNGQCKFFVLCLKYWNLHDNLSCCVLFADTFILNSFELLLA